MDIAFYVRSIRSGKYKEVKIETGDTTIDLGLLDKSKCNRFIEVMQDAIEELKEE